MERFSSIACDITSHCNNRCVFCLNEWPKATLMEEKIFKIVVDHMYDYVDQWIFIACHFEPTLHPHFLDFLEYIPEEKKNKFFFTSNIAKKFPEGYFQRMARCNFHHINISLETLDENRYAFITKNTRGNFYKNLNTLISEFSKVKNHPEIRFITMVTRDNKDEILTLAKYAKEVCNVQHHEFRTPFFSPFISKDWLLNHTLNREELDKIEEGLRSLDYISSACIDLQFCNEYYKKIIDDGNYRASYPQIAVWAGDGKNTMVPLIKTGHVAIPRISARGHFTADTLDYAYDLGHIEDYEIFMSSVLTYVTQKESGMQPEVRIRTKRTLLEKFKKFCGVQ